MLNLGYDIDPRIKLADEALVLYLANGDDATQVRLSMSLHMPCDVAERRKQVTLQVADGSSNNQFWYMHSVSSN